MKGTLYGVGVGPGDPELMTIKAVRLIRENAVIACPGKNAAETVAYKIALQAEPSLRDKTLLSVEMPMTLDPEALERGHQAAAELVETHLKEGRNVVFLTLGDPSIYSTYLYVQKRIAAQGYPTELVPGVTSFCAAAARANVSLAEWEEQLHIVPAVHRLDRGLELPDNYILMKSGRRMKEVKELLRQSGKDVVMVENCGMPDERIYRSTDEIPDDAGYYSLIIAKEPKKVIELSGLTKRFDKFTAVDGIDLAIADGEFFGLLGPNGAGKTTTIGMLSTLLLPTAGEIRIDGERLNRQQKEIKRKVSVVTQEYSMRQDMNMDEIMEYQGRLYYMPVKEIRAKTEALFEFAGLAEHRRKTVRRLSGGMKRKLMVCRALLTGPKLLLLDEPTAGMDAISRRQMWNLLRRLNRQGLTILLTTHYMEEAQSLCGRVALMDGGRLTEVDTPAALIEGLGAFAVDELLEDGVHSRYFSRREDAIGCLSGLEGRCALRDTTLEDVFVERVGRKLS